MISRSLMKGRLDTWNDVAPMLEMSDVLRSKAQRGGHNSGARICLKLGQHAANMSFISIPRLTDVDPHRAGPVLARP
jgi:hypothetical protein